MGKVVLNPSHSPRLPRVPLRPSGRFGVKAPGLGTVPPDPRLPAVKLNGGRHVQGILRGFDPFMNLVIDECVEMAPGGQQNNIGMVVSARGTGGTGGECSGELGELGAWW